MEMSGKVGKANEVDGGKTIDGHSKDQKSRMDQHKPSCQPCLEDRKHLEAQGYCTNCNEYLCHKCIKIHQKVTLTRNHVLLNSSAMAGAGATSGGIDSGKDKLTAPCPTHPCEVTKYYCRSHNETACSACVTEDHSDCVGVNYIPAISKGVGDSSECRDIEQALTALLDTMSNAGMQASNSRDDLIKSGAEYLRDLKACRNKVMDIIDGLVKDADDQYKDYVDAMTHQLNSVCKLSHYYSDRITSVRKDIRHTAKRGRDNKLFLLLKEAKALIAECKTSTSGIKHQCNVNPRVFIENKTLLDHLHSCDAIGQLGTETVSCMGVDMNSRGPTDKYTCDIVGLFALEDGRLILSDSKNENLKLFENNTLVSNFPLQSSPCDIAEIDGGVAVCLSKNNTIQFMSVSDTLTPVLAIKTAVPCFSVTRCGDNLAAVHYLSRDIVEIDMRGRKGKTIWTCPYGELWYIRNNTGGELITTDEGGGVTRVTRDGVVLARYNGDNFVNPRGLTVHPDGSIYVCDWMSENIHHITADCTRIEIFGDGKCSDPNSICYNQHDNSLYVSGVYDTINVFSLGY